MKKTFIILLLAFSLISIICNGKESITEKKLQEWDFNYTGLEKDLIMEAIHFNETTTEFCVYYLNKTEYISNLIIQSKDLRSIPIQKKEENSNFNILTDKVNMQEDMYCFYVVHPENTEDVSFKVGWDGILIDTRGEMKINLDTSNKIAINVSFIYKDFYNDIGNVVWYWNDSKGNWNYMGNIDYRSLEQTPNTWNWHSIGQTEKKYFHNGFAIKFLKKEDNNLIINESYHNDYWLTNVELRVDDSLTRYHINNKNLLKGT